MKRLKKNSVKDLFYFFFKIQFIRYLINGGFLFVIDFFIFYFFNKIIGIPIYFSQMISRGSSATVGFFTHKYFVFKNKDSSLFKFSLQGLLFTGLLFFNVFFSSVVISILYYKIKIKNTIILKIITEVIILIESYIFLNLIFFKFKKGE